MAAKREPKAARTAAAGPTVVATRQVAVGQLRPHPGNPRRGDVETIKRSLEAHGQYRAIVARQGTNEVLAGNHTLLAARALGWGRVLVHYVDVDDDQAKRILLVDNRANDLAGYDDAELAALLGELPDLDGTGYDADDVAALFARAQDVESGERPARTVTERPVTAAGEVWLLGDHRLHVGEATQQSDMIVRRWEDHTGAKAVRADGDA